MSARHEQSSLLLEQSISPPHLLSPDMAATMPNSDITEPARPQSPVPSIHLQTTYRQESPNMATPEVLPPAVTETGSAAEAPDHVESTTSTREVNETSADLPEVGSGTQEANGESTSGTTIVETPTQPESTESTIPETLERQPSAETQVPIQSGDVPAAEASDITPPAIPTAGSADPVTLPPPPPEPEVEEEPEDNTPSWVTYEEDYTTPDEEEMKEIEASEYDKLSATDITAIEDQFYSDLDDPEQRPAKKLRLNWVIKGLRGTKEKPNMARVMASPAVCVDGLYWSIKFYPRGDNCTSLSAFVRCSRNPPKQVEEMPEHSFAFFEGPPDADFGNNYEPRVRVFAPNTQKAREQPKPTKKEATPVEETKKSNHDDEDSDDSAQETAPREPESSDRREDEDGDIHDSTEEDEEKALKDWRVSAQLGMVIYNPNEPRTGHLQSDGHQFSKHCDDWGWVNFVGPWDEIHKRKRGQRQPLLRDDTIAIDAYVRIYDDPTQALWWHDSKNEGQWPSKQLAGYYPMGTPSLYHSPAVAGLTAWALLAPFRSVVQNADGGLWRRESSAEPKPLICQSQLVLHQMRSLSSDCYVNIFKVVEELMEADEPWEDVKSFWEVYRRSLSLELGSENPALKGFSEIFDAAGKPFEMPSVSVPGEKDIASGLAKYFSSAEYKGPLPNFMPVMLTRQQFDKAKREWKLHHDRVRLSDELDLAPWSSDDDAKYTLYGFVAHVGSRNSGKFYSVLRPGGIGSKWLAFEDGNGNKVFSYTKKRIQDFEGLEGDELKNFSGSRENAYMAMYIRTSCFKEYLLPDGLESYRLPKWMRQYSDGNSDDLSETERKQEDDLEVEMEKKREEEGFQVELYLDEYVKDHENMLDLHTLRMSPKAKEYCQTVTIATDKTYRNLRQAITDAFELDSVTKIGLWEMSYRSLGKYSRAELETVTDRRRIERDIRPDERWRMWISVLEPAEGRTSYKDLLPKIAEKGLDIKAVVEEPATEPTVQADKAEDEPVAIPDVTTPTVENPAGESSQLSVDTSSNHTEDSTTTGIATPATGATGDSAADIEQESVAVAVAADVETASAAHNVIPQVEHEPPRAVETEQSDLEAAAPVANPQNDGTHTAAPEHPSVEPAPPVEHGHLADLIEPASTSLSNEEAMTGDLDQQNLALVSGTDGLSAEDAAAIAAVLAADAEENAAAALQAVETITPDQAATTDMPSGATADATSDHETNNALQAQFEPDPEPQPPTPQLALHVYGFIHIFDAPSQKFIAQQPFNPEIEHEIGSEVRKALKYDEDRDIRIWRREGPSGTAPVTISSTFVGASLQDGFTLIVGDVLPESEVEDLKNTGKFWKPQQLIKYLITTRRGHPILSKTTSEPVEITEFGRDYFRGSLVNGQPHGQDCLLITSSGHTYEGPLVAGLKSGGNGKMTYQNGDVYTGGWLNDERHGQGEHIEARTGNRYVGGFENGKKWGEGVTYWKVADDQAAMCQICYGEEIDALFFDCGHVCACVECAKQCETCPICRKSVRQVVKMFRA